MVAHGGIKARLLTIGTEIVCGEIVNSNASWVSLRLEELGLRVFSHLSVRDDRSEILTALSSLSDGEYLIVTGGLGPTSDDITRECVAEHCGAPLEFDTQVWNELESTYGARGLKLLEAHKHQCHFPVGSTRLKNSAGTALGFMCEHGHQKIFVLPGPPSELQRMWKEEVDPRIRKSLKENSSTWKRWTVLGVPESEVADIVDRVTLPHSIEVGYRATYPYVKVKAYLDAKNPVHADLEAEITEGLKKWLIGRGDDDLADAFLTHWPRETLTLVDEVTDTALSDRLVAAQRRLKEMGLRSPKLCLNIQQTPSSVPADVRLAISGESLEVSSSDPTFREVVTLPFKVKLDSERGKRAAVEWALWSWVKRYREIARG